LSRGAARARPGGGTGAGCRRCPGGAAAARAPPRGGAPGSGGGGPWMGGVGGGEDPEEGREDWNCARVWGETGGGFGFYDMMR